MMPTMDIITVAEPLRERLNAGGDKPCIVCSHPHIDGINEEILKGTPFAYLPTQYGGFSRFTLHRHLRDCVKVNSEDIKRQLGIDSTNSLYRRFEYQLAEAEDALQSAKKTLIVEGELDFNPRAWEVNIVYYDNNDCDERTGKPKLKTATLETLLAKVGEGGYAPKHTFIKSEDMRKVYLKTLERLDSLLDRFARIFGIYQKDAPNVGDEFNRIKELVQRAVKEMGTDYQTELQAYLETYGARLRSDLRGMLEKESQAVATALAGPGVEVKALPPAPTPSADSAAKPSADPTTTQIETIDENIGEKDPEKI